MQQKKKNLLIAYKGNSVIIMAYFSLEIMKARKKLNNILRVGKSINKNEEICFRCKGTSSSKVKRQKKILQANNDQKSARLITVISDKISFKIKLLCEEKDML